MNLARWDFNFYYSLSFWLAFLVIFLILRLAFPSGRARSVVLCLASALMLLALPGFGLLQLGLVLILTLLTFFMGRALLLPAPAASSSKKKFLLSGGVLSVLSFLAFFKYGIVQEIFLQGNGPGEAGPADLVRLIGVSYFSFRMIHFLVESYRGKIEGFDLLDYINYIIFFPAFISGPINRYNHFISQFRSPDRSRLASGIRVGGERIIHGLFKKFVLAQILYPHILTTQPEVLARTGPIEALLGLYAYALYFYFDFAGYTDLALGCARIIGIDLPENFNNPFLKRNIRELWTNWHIALTSWLVDYIYWPIVRKLRSFDYFRRHPLFLSNLGMIITFVACGMWHGESTNFILWGAYHGFGIAILTVYQREKRKVRSPFLRKYFRSNFSTVLGTILTFNFFAIGLSLFVLDIGRLRVLALAVMSRF
jgi:alginate O-acetyltransferase complex protein AlgI